MKGLFTIFFIAVLLMAGTSANAAIVEFTAYPNPVESGQTVRVSWEATSARSCSLSGQGQTHWFPATHSVSAPLDETTTVTLRCGQSSERLTIDVVDDSPGPAPNPEPDPDDQRMDLSIVPEVVESGGTATISWDASWAESCRGTGFEEARLPTANSVAVSVDQTTTFTVTCDGVTESVTARVEAPPAPGPTPNPGSCRDLGRGIADPCAALGFDVFADYSVDRVITGNQGQMSLNGNGTASDPYVIDARRATFSRAGVSGQYVVVIGGTVDASPASGPFFATENCRRCVIRDVEVSGPKTDESHSSAVTLSSDTVWIGGSIHGFGDNRPSAREQDFHGMKIMSSNVWVIDAEIYDVSGDSIQCGDASRGRCENVYISGGHFHDNRENAVDIKDSRNVVVSGVRMDGFRPTNSSNGVALVMHDDARNAKIYDNDISDSAIGIVSSGVSGHEVTGNTVQATSIGIDVRSTQPITVTDNDISAPQCVRRGGGVTGTVQTGCN